MQVFYIDLHCTSMYMHPYPYNEGCLLKPLPRLSIFICKSILGYELSKYISTEI